MNRVYELVIGGKDGFKNLKESAPHKVNRAMHLLVWIEGARNPVSRANLRNLYMVASISRWKRNSEIKNELARAIKDGVSLPSIPDAIDADQAIQELSKYSDPTQVPGEIAVALEYDAYSDSALQMLVDLKLIKETEESTEKVYSITTRGELVVAYYQDGGYKTDILKTLARLS